jgi:hypothetical protein
MDPSLEDVKIEKRTRIESPSERVGSQEGRTIAPRCPAVTHYWTNFSSPLILSANIISRSICFRALGLQPWKPLNLLTPGPRLNPLTSGPFNLLTTPSCLAGGRRSRGTCLAAAPMESRTTGTTRSSVRWVVTAAISSSLPVQNARNGNVYLVAYDCFLDAVFRQRFSKGGDVTTTLYLDFTSIDSRRRDTLSLHSWTSVGYPSASSVWHLPFSISCHLLSPW